MIGVHVVEKVREKLERDARAADRSLSNHVEMLIERSLDRQDLVPEVLTAAYGPEMAGLLMTIASAMSYVSLEVYLQQHVDTRGTAAPQPPRNMRPSITDPQSFHEAAKAVRALLERLSPGNSDQLSSKMATNQAEDERSIGELAAEIFFHALADPTSQSFLSHNYDTLRKLLGPLAPKTQITGRRKQGRISSKQPA
jgi:hypothetical protein